MTVTLPEVRYKIDGKPLQIELKAKGPTLASAVYHGMDAVFEHKEVRQKRFGLIQIQVQTEFHPSKITLPLQAPNSPAIEQEIFPVTRSRYQRGSVQLRGKRKQVWVGRWREDVIVDGHHQRVHRRVILGTLKEYPHKALALRALDSKLRKVNSFDYRPNAVLTFSALVDKWMNLHLPQLKPSSQVSFRNHISRWLLPLFGPVYLHQIGGEQIQRFINSINLSPKTVRNIIATFRVLWKAAKSWQYVDHNCFDGIRFPRSRIVCRPFLTIEQMQRIIASSEEPYRTIYWILAETGLRSGEIFGLSIDDIDLARFLLTVRRSVWQGKIQLPKTKKALRHCLMSPDLTAHLAGFLGSWKANEQRFLFATRSGTAMAADNVIKRHLKPLLQTLGIPPAGLHSFRHGNSSIMDHLSTPLKVRQDRLGHADVTLTLNTYTHTSSEDERKLVEQLGRCLKPNSKS